MNLLDRAQPYFDQLEKRVLTISALAKLLQCNENYLSRLLSVHLKRCQSSTKTREKLKLLFETRKQMRKKHADLVRNGSKSLKRAAADARCSERTIRRYMET